MVAWGGERALRGPMHKDCGSTSPNVSTRKTVRRSVASGDAIGSRKRGIDMFATVFTSMSVTSSRFWWVSVPRSVDMRELELGWRSTCALSSWSSKFG